MVKQKNLYIDQQMIVGKLRIIIQRMEKYDVQIARDI